MAQDTHATNATLHAPALAVWSTIASEWDKSMGRDGNVYWQDLERPALARLLKEKQWKVSSSGSKPLYALDISTGNGLTARWLEAYLRGGGGGGGGSDGSEDGNTKESDESSVAAAEAVHVTATDGSPVMLEMAKAWAAREREQEEAGGRLPSTIQFAELDVTKPEHFAPFVAAAEKTPFDVVLMNMAIMDVPTLEPLAAALPQLLAVNGVFIGSLLHPVFITSRARRNLEIVQEAGDNPDAFGLSHSSIRRSVTLARYLDVEPWKGYAVAKQSVSQFYFHRPLHELFGTFLRGGQLVLDGIEEPAFGPDHAAAADSIYSSKTYTQFPPVLVFRLRRIK